MSPSRSPLYAYVDESESVQIVDPNTYLLAAALCSVADLDIVRDAMRRLLLKGQRTVHWRDESDKRRHLIIDTVASVPIEHVVVIREGHAGERPERRRRHCLEQLCYELDRRAVTNMIAESRGPADDKRDRDMLDALRARRVVTGPLRLDHLTGPAEALLWLPDAVCGAFVRARTGDTGYTATLGERITVIATTARR
jgi:hypothetical protein